MGTKKSSRSTIALDAQLSHEAPPRQRHQRLGPEAPAKDTGFYQGYKVYRFAGKAANRLPLTDFSQVAALYDFDTQLKVLFYSRVMAIETALKNYTLEAVLEQERHRAFPRCRQGHSHMGHLRGRDTGQFRLVLRVPRQARENRHRP